MFDWLETFWRAHFTVPTSWAAATGISLGVLLAGVLLYRLAFAVFRRVAASTATNVDDILVRRMRLPARLLIGLLSLHTFLVMRAAGERLLQVGVTLVELLLAAYLVIEALETLFIDYWLEERKQLQVPAVLRHLMLVVLYTVAVLSIVGSVTGINVVPLLATSTVVTVVVGLALQDTLGNLFSGLALHVEQPFGLGDWILVDGIEGQVIYMGWRSTRLKTFSSDVVVLPNSIIARARVQNFYAPEKMCARNVEFPVHLDAAPGQVEEAVRRACARVPEVREDPAPKIWLVAVTPLFQRYIVKVWIDDFRFHDDVESELMKALWHTVREEGIALDSSGAGAGVDGGSGQAVVAVPKGA